MPKEPIQAIEKRAKSKKDKGTPTKARSPYMFFTMEWRGKVKKQNPNAELGQVAKIIGTKWKELSNAEKAPYVEKYERDKERAAADKQQYQAKTSHSRRKGAPRAIHI